MNRRFSILIVLCYAGFAVQSGNAQLPSDLPWSGSNVNGQGVIVQPGIAVASCGTLLSIDPANRYSVGMWNIDGAVPGAGRVDATLSTSVYHHPSWRTDEIGNIFGVAVNERTGDILMSASSNYAAGFLGQASVLQYGNIGGGANDLSAAGTIYRADAVTGQASVFAVLPQQSTTFTHINCEGNDTLTRTNTGVGLGNVHYDSFHDQYFATNIEDGRIYRLSPSGSILESYDPGVYDDGAPGISDLTDLVQGIAVEPNGSRLFFGGVSNSASVSLRSIDLSPSGAFVGSVNNTSLHGGATWNNIVGAETSHANLAAENFGSNHAISDLEFTSGGKLLAGVRVFCGDSWFSSYNHTGESNEISRNANGLYNQSIEFDASFDGPGMEDSYGGVADYVKADGSVDYIVSSADILNEAGPHGLAVFPAANAASTPINPLAAVSYGAVDLNDPKGVGGSVDVFSMFMLNEAPLSELLTGTIIKSGDKEFTEFTYSPIGEMPAAEDIIVKAITDADGNFGIRFQGAFVDSPSGGPSDALIEYKVTAGDGQLIHDVHMQANPLVLGGDDGLVSITETFLPDNDQTVLSVYDIPGGERKLTDWADLMELNEDGELVPAPEKELHVQKDIIVWSQEPGTAATMSFFDQTFSQCDDLDGNGACDDIDGEGPVPVNLVSADLDFDGDVDDADMAMWENAMGTSQQGDADGDGDSDGADFLAWQRQTGGSVVAIAAASTVPEPAALAMIVSAIMIITTGSRFNRQSYLS